MSYIENNLLKDEKIIFNTKLNALQLFYMPFLCALWGAGLVYIEAPIVGVTLLFIGLTMALRAYVMYLSSQFVVTNKRVLIKVGFIRRTSLELMLEKIEAINLDQSIVGRVIDSGSVIVVGSGGTKTPFPNIDSPVEFRKKAQEQIELRAAA